MHGVGAWHLVRAGDGTGDDSTHTHREANDAQRMGSGMDRAWGQSSACAAVDGNALLSIGIPRIRPTRDSPMLRCDADESEPTTRMSDTDSTSVGWAAESSMRRARGAEKTVYRLFAMACIVSDDSIFSRGGWGAMHGRLGAQHAVCAGDGVRGAVA